jgi:hypothetical protein
MAPPDQMEQLGQQRRQGGGGDKGEGETRGRGRQGKEVNQMKKRPKRHYQHLLGHQYVFSFLFHFFFFTNSFLGTDLNYSEEERTARTPTTTTTNILAPSTPNHGHEQLLMWWKWEQGDGTQEMRTRMGG